jgi:hypothetical protein
LWREPAEGIRKKQRWMKVESEEGKERLLKEAVEKAKARVIEAYEHCDHTERQWLHTFLDSYQTSDYRVELHVLEGSPCKGFVVVNRGRGEVIAFDCRDKRLYTWKIRELRTA